MKHDVDSAVIATEHETAENIHNAERRFNANLQGLRGLAALLVFVFHVFDMSRKLVVIPVPLWVEAALGAMPAGVDMFFMISGYLITGSLIRHANVRTFLLDRIARIYPVFLFLHVFLFSLAPIIKYKWMEGITPALWIFNFCSNLLFLPGIFNLPLMQLNAWSLSYEAAFYLLSALIYVLWPRFRWLALVLLLGVSPGLIALYPRAAFFVVGVSVFFLVNGDRSARIARFPRLGWLGLFGFLSVMGYALMPGHIYAALLALPFGFLFFLDVARQTPAISAALRSGLMQFFGTISYSFYLWHPVVTYPLKFAMAVVLIGRLGAPPVVAMIIFGLAAFVLTVPVSWISWRVLEKGGGSWVKSKFAGYRRSDVRAGGIPEAKA